jgi:metacaspase-1
MKHFFSLFLSLFLVVSAYAQTKRALLVGIDEYPVGTWNKTHAKNNFPILKKSLITQGFSKIDTLEGRNATKKRIIEALKQMTQNAQKGDICFFYFIGHGQQMEDKYTKDESDGYDESIVPYDAKRHYEQNGYKGENHLSDDELNSLFNELREKIGVMGQLIVVIDACHSGTITRSISDEQNQDYLGTNTIMASDEYQAKITQQKSLTIENNFIEHKAQINEKIAPMIAFFGSSAKEVNYLYKLQGKMYGSLTFAFCKYFAKVNSELTYKMLFEQIRAEMMSFPVRNIPQAEGELNKYVLNGKIDKKTNFYTFRKVNSEAFIANCGSLEGISVGDKLGFFPNSVSNIMSIEPISTAIVTECTPIECTLKLTEQNEQSLSQNTHWVVPILKNIDLAKITISVKNNDKTLNKYAQLISKNNSNIESVNKSDAKLFLGYNSKNQIIIENQYAEIWDTCIKNEEDKIVENIAQSIQQYMLYEFTLQHLKDENNTALKASLQLQICEDAECQKILDTLSINSDEAKRQLKEGTFFRYIVKNEGTSPFYFNILDIQFPKISISIPNNANGVYGGDCYLESNKSLLVDLVFQVSKPYNQEMFKLITSEQIVDLSHVYDTAKSRSILDASSPLEKLLLNAKKKTRNPKEQQQVTPSGIGIHSLLIKVVEVAQ